jgi:hypothetical protein
MGVDERVVLCSIQGVLHNMAERINTHEDGRAAFCCNFRPEGFEDGPGDVGVSGTEFAEASEGDVGLEGDGEGVLLGYFYAFQDGVVGFADLVEPVGSVCGLGP